MKKPMVRIYDVETNETIDREMTDAEFAAYQADQVADAALKAEAAAKAEAKAAILEKLGLTEEDLRVVLG